MNEKAILDKLKFTVFDLLKNESTGHDNFHIERVVNNTKKIMKHEECDTFYTLLLAYLHDVGDYKIHAGIDKTEEMVEQILWPLIPNKMYIQQVIDDIHLIGYQGGMNENTDKIEIKIVQDADRLDAIGAIGIARTFAYSGSKGRVLYNPNYKAKEYNSIEEYKNSDAPTIQHFYDKLLKLKDQMNTVTGKKLAEERHAFMESFLDQFYHEYND